MRRFLLALWILLGLPPAGAQDLAVSPAVIDGLPPVTVELSETDRALIRELTASINRAADLASEYVPEPPEPPGKLDPPDSSDPSEPAPPPPPETPMDPEARARLWYPGVRFGGKTAAEQAGKQGTPSQQLVWKPDAETSSGLVVLTPADLHVTTLKAMGKTLSRPDSISNGYRPTWRVGGNPSGKQTLELILSNGDRYLLYIKDSARAYRSTNPPWDIRRSGADQVEAPTRPTTPEPGNPSGQFQYIPGTDSVTIIIPPGIEHYQFHVFGRRKHVALYGPDRSGSGRYVIPMSPARLQAAARAAGETDGSIMAYVNTNKVYPDARGVSCGKQVGWRIMNPLVPQSGDGDRLLCGEDR